MNFSVQAAAAECHLHSGEMLLHFRAIRALDVTSLASFFYSTVGEEQFSRVENFRGVFLGTTDARRHGEGKMAKQHQEQPEPNRDHPQPSDKEQPEQSKDERAERKKTLEDLLQEDRFQSTDN
ncbi:MAG: hypothetical protein C5B57_07655 [Blastocatellia bacterium]|nr:MAG: hypothetical protein C5B57_07655 [Blastocatellia bacterium]